MAIPLPGKALPRHDVTKGGSQADAGNADDDQPSVAAELRALWGMAAPITALNCVVYLRAMVSVLCLGRLGPLDLAGGALAIGLTNITGHSVLFGLASGLEPLCAQAFGSRNHELLTLSVQRAVLLLFLAAVPIALLWLNVGPILVALGQDPTISAHAASYAAFALPDLAAGAVLQPLRVYLRSQGITRPMAACSAIAVALHVLLNVALVFAMGLGAGAYQHQHAAVPTRLHPLGARQRGHLEGLCAPRRRRQRPPRARQPRRAQLRWWYEVVTVLAGYLPNPAAAGVLIQTTSLMYTVPMALAACVSTWASHLLKYDLMLGTFKADVKIVDDTTIRPDGKPITVVSSTDPLKLPWIELGIDIVIEGTGVFVDGRRRQAHRRQRATDPPLPFDVGQLRWWA